MKYVTEFRNSEAIKSLSAYLHKISNKEITIMEVCGSHTMSVHRFGIHDLLPEHIHLISGPGCPVCVTSIDFMDKAIALARLPNTIITTFGDLIKVPGSTSSLEKERANGADIRIVFSINEALEMAERYPDKEIVFLAIGFETTTPPTAAGVLRAHSSGIKNFSILSAHKIMPPPMQALIEEGIPIDGFLAPGHVSTITGIEMYRFIPEKFRKGVVVSGFEPTDILQSVIMLVQQFEKQEPNVEIQYRRVVKPEGNIKAMQMIEEVFEVTSANWRGLGNLPNSALQLKKRYAHFDAEKKFQISLDAPHEPKGCICGLILKGLRTPPQCTLFGKLCTPDNPVGACMVSSEGACNVFYRYKK
ncbi:MAG: hydrogenase formation protein HypD [Bacteroidales bacterium]|nr:hydrogenase formation protein HypD [Bacteroidales bacterium]